MAEKVKRFHILLSTEELEEIKKEADKRKISASEFVRMSIKSETTSKTSYDKILAIKALSEIITED